MGHEDKMRSFSCLPKNRRGGDLAPWGGWRWKGAPPRQCAELPFCCFWGFFVVLVAGGVGPEFCMRPAQYWAHPHLPSYPSCCTCGILPGFRSPAYSGERPVGPGSSTPESAGSVLECVRLSWGGLRSRVSSEHLLSPAF